MVRHIENDLALIEKWLRNKNIIKFLGIWVVIYNPDFNSPEFEGIGLNRFVLSVKQWTEKPNREDLSCVTMPQLTNLSASRTWKT